MIHLASPSGEQSQCTEAELHTMHSNGQLLPGTLYWREGMADWLPVETFFGDVVGTESLSNPNAAPQSNRYHFRKDIKGLAKVVLVLLFLGVVGDLVSLYSDVLEKKLLARDFTMEEANINDARQSVIGIATLILYVVTAIPFLMWISRANANCHGFHARGMRFTPGWAVGWYFIPIMNLFRPYQVMAEIWKVSKRPQDWESLSTPGIVSAWWALWLIAAFVGRLYFRLAMKAETIPELQSLSNLSLFVDVLSVFLTLVAFKLVSSITRMQTDLVESNALIEKGDSPSAGTW